MDVYKWTIIVLLTTSVVLNGSHCEEGEVGPEINIWVRVDDQHYVTFDVHTANQTQVNDTTWCAPPEPPLNGHYEADGLLYNDGDTIRYHCHPGHQLVGEVVRTCNGTSRQWHPQQPHCQPEYVGRVLSRLNDVENNATVNDRRITTIENSIESMEDSVAAIEKQMTTAENLASTMTNTMSTTDKKVSDMVNIVSKVESRLSSLEVSMSADHVTLTELMEERRPNNTWKIVGLCDRLNEEEDGEMVSQLFSVPGSDYSAQTRIRWNKKQDDIQFDLRFKESRHDNGLNIKEYPVVVYVIVDQSQDKLEQDLSVIGFHYINSPTLDSNTFGFDHGTKLSKVQKERERYCANGITYIKTLVEDPEQASRSVQSYNGRLRWTIDEWSVRRREEVEGWREFQYSDPFYSGRPGYKMRLVLYVNGERKYIGKAVTIGMRILKGRWDHLMPDVTTFETKLTMRDQSSNLVKDPWTMDSVDRAGKRGGYFVGKIPHNSIIDDVHLVDDSISIKVEVESS